MVTKKLAIRCDLCYNVIEDTGKCYCGKLAAIRNRKFLFIYTDEELFSFVSVYQDDKERKVKVIEVDFIKKAFVTLPVASKVLDMIKPIKD